MQKFVAFYWTRPVPWMGFTDFSKPRWVDSAAQQSRTIRYQVERVRTHVLEAGGQLMEEILWIHDAPDRGSSEAVAALKRAASLKPAASSPSR